MATRQLVYQSDDALKVDEIDHFEIVRKRVYFDDVLLATMHRQVGISFVITMALFFLLLLGIAVAFESAREMGISAGFAIASLPFLLALLSRLLLRQEIITIYGRRSKAAMKFTFRKTFAHEKFDEICSLVTQAQERIAAEQRAMEPPPVAAVSEFPMPPEMNADAGASSEEPRPDVMGVVSPADSESATANETPSEATPKVS